MSASGSGRARLILMAGAKGRVELFPDGKKDVTAVAESGSRIRKMREGGDVANARGKL